MNNMDDDKRSLNDLFEEDGMEVPESLSKEAIRAKLDEHDAEDGIIKDDTYGKTAVLQAGDPVKKTVTKRSFLKPLGAVAAVCACLLIMIVPSMKAGKTAGDLQFFKSYDEISNTIKQINNSWGIYGDKELVEDYASEDQAAVPNSGQSLIAPKTNGQAVPRKAVSGAAAIDSAAPDSGSSNAGHSETYLQVKNVDEADYVKCDDNYIYYIDSSFEKIIICKVKNGKHKKVAEIKTSSRKSFDALFLKDDDLIAISEFYTEDGEDRTVATVYDVTDRTAPVKKASYVQSGRLISQRMAGGVVYIVTDQYAYDNEVPLCGTVEKAKNLKPNDICYLSHARQAEYTIVGAVDVASGKEMSHVTKAVLGGSQDIYANGENLYIAGSTFDDHQAQTVVIRVKMADGNIKMEKTGKVPGVIDDQFSMDEKDGEFRIATTSVSDDGEDVNNLFVLDKDLKVKGSVSGFAEGESIKAVRYIKDKAYVITYEQTDPLFVIDLSDSSKPNIEGEVKIDGFSTLLVPITEDKILGIGYSTKKVEEWTETAGLKFVIFDVSDPSKPVAASSKTFDDVYSEVQDDHRGLVVLGEGEKSRFIIPCSETRHVSGKEDDDEWIEDEYTGSALEISCESGKVKVVGHHKTDAAVSRCPVIGDHIYAIMDSNKIKSFELSK